MASTVRVTVQRFNPARDAEPHFETYEVPVRDTTSVTNVLYDVNAIHGAAIAYRVSCHRGICASCRMKVNGKARLACCHPVDGGEIKLEPSMGFAIVKDLVTVSDWKGLGREDDTDELLE